jgi:tetratricopeptide (TPR) repeat protein
VPSADQYIQRAELLADLGRYEDAAGELGNLVAAEPDNVRALTMLARIRLAAEQPAEAIVAADAAVAADPKDLAALVARGMVLVQLDRARDAADTAERILRLAPEDGYAQTSAAAILAEARNGQRALDAAWRGVQLAPEDSTAHLVLGLVAARMQLYDLAERAYREALRLDPQLAAARHDIGIVRLEQRRYAEALEHLVEAAVVVPADPAGGQAVGYGLRQVLHVGAGYALIAPIIAACVGAGANDGTFLWRVTAVLLAVFGFVGVGVFLAQLPKRVSELLPALLRADRRLAVATSAVVAAPCLILLYALVGSPWPLAAAIAAGAIALLSTVLGAPAAR